MMNFDRKKAGIPEIKSMTIKGGVLRVRLAKTESVAVCERLMHALYDYAGMPTVIYWEA